MNFSDLNLNKALLDALEENDFLYPTPIQYSSFPVIMSGRDIIGIAQTGTGKTFAYLLPIIRLFQYSTSRNPKVLILVPTRELVIQITAEIEKLTKYMPVRVLGVYGGTNINAQKELVYEGLDILVGTPGRVIDLGLSGVLKLKDVRKLVIDEVDEIFQQGFRHQLVTIFDMLPERRQNILFSATTNPKVLEMTEEYFMSPEIIEITPSGTPIEKIVQRSFRLPNFYTKINFLKYLMQNDREFEKVLIFISIKRLADLVYDSLPEEIQEICAVIHSNKSQNYRINSIKSFEEGKVKYLIATDVASRGLDFKEVSHVINFDIPEEPRDYIHRIGRTGRADRDGVAISFITENEKPLFEEIELLMGRSVECFDIPEDVERETKLLEEENPKLFDKNYLPKMKTRKSMGYHEKSEKNRKALQRTLEKKSSGNKRKFK